jgi:acyl carrier protein
MDITRDLVRTCLNLDASTPLTADTFLMGGFPEFDSMTIMALIEQIEEALGCEIDDDEISGETFETVGSLAAFVAEKMGSPGH